MTIDHDQLKADVDAGTPRPWAKTEGNTIYALQPCKWAGLDSFENRWQAQVSGKSTTPQSELDANANLMKLAPDLAAAYLAATARIAKMEAALTRLRDCDWVIALPDRMDAVRAIAKDALE